MGQESFPGRDEAMETMISGNDQGQYGAACCIFPLSTEGCGRILPLYVAEARKQHNDRLLLYMLYSCAFWRVASDDLERNEPKIFKPTARKAGRWVFFRFLA